jgi:hypothetical protein
MSIAVLVGRAIPAGTAVCDGTVCVGTVGDGTARDRGGVLLDVRGPFELCDRLAAARAGAAR